jgi:hypothetical protein
VNGTSGRTLSFCSQARFVFAAILGTMLIFDKNHQQRNAVQ